MLAASMKRLGEEYVVETAYSGDKALAKAQQTQYALLITDYMMPGMNGLELALAVRRISPRTKIVLVTAYGTDRLRDQAEQLSLAGYLDRPFTGAQIREVVQQAVQEPTLARRILILEDEDDLRRLYSKALRHAGYDVHEAATLQEARDLLARYAFDAFLCDIHVGGDRGTDLLREQSEALKVNGTQIIMVSAEAQHQAMCEEIGAEFFMQKPVALAPLITLVDRLTSRR
jgi:two-component system response regulator AtoC